MIPIRRSSRGGFGAALGVVLGFLVIALIIVLGTDSLNRGSRNTLARVVGRARALAIAQQAIDEAFFSSRGQKMLESLLTASLGSSKGTPDLDRLVVTINSLELDDPAGPPEVPDGTDLVVVAPSPDTTVNFRGVSRRFAPEILRKVLTAEPVRVKDVILRPVLFTRRESRDPKLQGLARAEVSVSYRHKTETYQVHLVVERCFQLKQESVDEDSKKWCVATDPEAWRTGAGYES